MRRVRTKALATAVAAVAALAMAGSASAADPIRNCTGGFKIEDPADGTYTFGAIRITLAVNEAEQTFDFTSNVNVSQVFVKGGPNSKSYSLGGVREGDDLHAPRNLRSGEWYGLSHICFYTDGGKNDGKK